ncbi:transglycosylase SLT domain-containing protein [Leucobacter sp. G161]|uniref:aggregation-promoting factor C-terminal-like domain-containing protein n=1 Tax=Leucobacter sp. G161 TaxID=663704 RepID=UPI0009F98F58|nr:transglycosylase SLT domain-containing protein [Leucobacter sp. G161]
MTLTDANAEVVPASTLDDRLFQEFVPNVDPADDFVLPEVPIEKLPDPKPKPEPEPVKTDEPSAGETAAPATPAAPPRYEGGGSPAEWMAAAGIAEGNWGFVDFIAQKESGWNPNATNPSSGACGLIQALPCSKVPGSGYDPVDNLRWANGYATDRYGSWSGAYDFWLANNWW